MKCSIVAAARCMHFTEKSIQHIVINPDPRGLEMMHKLTDSADVFVENYRPGALNKLGLGYEELSQRNPKLVYCSVSAYGHTGPDAARAGFGLIAEAKSGAMSLIGAGVSRRPCFACRLPT